jgi:hypothetical protein
MTINYIWYLAYAAFGTPLFVRHFALYIFFPSFKCSLLGHSPNVFGDPVCCHFVVCICGLLPQLSKLLFVHQQMI